MFSKTKKIILLGISINILAISTQILPSNINNIAEAYYAYDFDQNKFQKQPLNSNKNQKDTPSSIANDAQREINKANQSLNRHLQECGEDSKCRVVAQTSAAATKNAVYSGLNNAGVDLKKFTQTGEIKNQNQNQNQKENLETMTAIVSDNGENIYNVDIVSLPDEYKGLSVGEVKLKLINHLRRLHSLGFLEDVPESQLQNISPEELMVIFGMTEGSIESEAGLELVSLFENKESIKDIIKDGYESVENKNDIPKLLATATAGAAAVVGGAYAMSNAKKKEDEEEDYDGGNYSQNNDYDDEPEYEPENDYESESEEKQELEEDVSISNYAEESPDEYEEEPEKTWVDKYHEVEEATGNRVPIIDNIVNAFGAVSNWIDEARNSAGNREESSGSGRATLAQAEEIMKKQNEEG